MLTYLHDHGYTWRCPSVLAKLVHNSTRVYGCLWYIIPIAVMVCKPTYKRGAPPWSVVVSTGKRRYRRAAHCRWLIVLCVRNHSSVVSCSRSSRVMRYLSIPLICTVIWTYLDEFRMSWTNVLKQWSKRIRKQEFKLGFDIPIVALSANRVPTWNIINYFNNHVVGRKPSISCWITRLQPIEG